MTLFRGLLPELSVEASELEIRSAIVKILHNNRSFQLEDFDVNDFEFMDVHGKKATVPTWEDNHQFTGKSIKQLAGVGAVYTVGRVSIPCLNNCK